MERVMLSASAAMLLLLSGDVETNPGPIGRSRSREPKPDPKKIMEEKVEEKLIAPSNQSSAPSPNEYANCRWNRTGPRSRRWRSW